MPKRTFTRDQLEEWGVPDDLPTQEFAANYPDSAVQLHEEQVDSRRWVSVHALIFRAPDDGKAYRVHYEQGLTEQQDGTDPWGYADTIEAVEVEPREVTVTRWEPVTN